MEVEKMECYIIVLYEYKKNYETWIIDTYILCNIQNHQCFFHLDFSIFKDVTPKTLV